MKIDRSTLPELMWYRLLKVLLYFAWGFVILLSLAVIVKGEVCLGFGMLIVLGGLLEIIRRAFFYICTGNATEKNEIEKLKNTGTKTAKVVGKVGAVFIGFFVFGFVAWILPPLSKIMMGLIIISFNLPPNPRVAADFEAIVNIGTFILAALTARQVYRAIARPKVTHKTFRFSWW